MGYAMKNYKYVIIALFSIISLLSLSVFHYKRTSMIFKTQRDSSNNLLNLANATIKNFNKRQQALFLLDKSHTEALNAAENENESLRSQLIAGTSRMYIRGKCPLPPSSTIIPPPAWTMVPPSNSVEMLDRIFSISAQPLSEIMKS